MISVIVCTYNRSSILSRMLQSFYEQEDLSGQSYELLVVDNNSTDHTRQVAEEFSQKLSLKYIFEPVQGLSRARNRGVSEARGDVVAFLDDDVLLDRHWLKYIALCFKETQADGVGGRIELLIEESPPAWLGPKFRRPLGELDMGSQRRIINPRETLFGGNLAFNKGLLRDHGGFNEILGRSGQELLVGEETALIDNLLSNNKVMIYEPQAVVWHIISPNRLKWSYHRQRAIDFGRTMALVEPNRNFAVRILRIFRAFQLMACQWLVCVWAYLFIADPYVRKDRARLTWVYFGWFLKRWSLCWRIRPIS